LSAASNAGSAAYLTQGLASGRIDETLFASSMWKRVLRSSFFTVAVVGFGVSTGESGLAICLAALLVPVSVLAQNVVVVPRATSRFALAGVGSAVDKFVALAVAGSLSVFTQLGPAALPLGLVAGALAGTGLVAMATPARQLYFRPRLNRSRRPVASRSTRSGWYTSAGLILALQSLDVLALRSLVGVAAAGEYAAVSKWGQPFTMVLSATNQVAFTGVAAARSGGEARRVMRKTLPVVTAVVGAALLVAVSSGALVELLLGPVYRNSGPVLALMMLGSVLSAFSQLLLTYLLGRRNPRTVAVAFAAGVLAQYCLMWVIAPLLGAAGGAISWVVGQATILVVMAFSLLLAGRSGK